MEGSEGVLKGLDEDGRSSPSQLCGIREGLNIDETFSLLSSRFYLPQDIVTSGALWMLVLDVCPRYAT